MTPSVTERAALGLIGNTAAPPLLPAAEAGSGAPATFELRVQPAHYRIAGSETTGVVPKLHGPSCACRGGAASMRA